MVSCKIRKPVVAGRFYPKDAKAINKEIDNFIGKGQTRKVDAVGCILPHAGYLYSGKVAATTLSGINIPELVILLGPNHTGEGFAYSIMTEGVWQTPSGEVRIDNQLAGLILKESRYLKEDALAHLNEHSLEVELPMLQYFKKDIRIIPIAFMSDNVSILREIGVGLANSILNHDYKGKVLLLASSDMTHYEPEEEARFKDSKAIDAILALDERRLIEDINSLNISMCGYAPVVVLLAAAKALGAKRGNLIIYQTSGDITKDKTSVVGYAGIMVN